MRTDPPTPLETSVHAHAAALAGAGLCEVPDWAVAAFRPSRRWHRAATDRVDAAAHRALWRSAPPSTRTRLGSASGIGAAEWLRAPPTEPALTLADPAFALAVRLRLGLDVCPDEPCPRVSQEGAPCREYSDARGSHALHCPSDGGVDRRHDGVARAIFHLLLEIPGLKVEWRPFCRWWPQTVRPGQPPLPGRPDLGVHGLPGRLPLYLDVTAVTATSAGRLGRLTVGAASRRAEWEKCEKYPVFDRQSHRRLHRVNFEPLALEAHGFWGRRATHTLRMLAGVSARLNGRDISAEVLRWRAYVAVALQRGNAAIFLGDAAPDGGGGGDAW